MNERKWMNRLTPVAGGIALALVLIASAVAHADPITICQSCEQRMWARANSDPAICANELGQARHGCISNYVYANCYANGICPDSTTAPGGTASCVGTIVCPGSKAVGICTNECWGLNCSSGTSKTCKDVQYYPPSLVSACNVTCGCN